MKTASPLILALAGLLISCGEGSKTPTTGSSGPLAQTAAQGAPAVPALPAPAPGDEPSLQGAEVWDDPAGDAKLWEKDPRTPVDVVKVWAVVRGKALHIGAKFRDPAAEFWKQPNDQGEFRNRLFMQFYLNSDGNYNTGGKAGPKGGPGFDTALQCFASAKYKDKRTGEIKKGSIGAKAEDFEFLEPDYFYTLHHCCPK